MLLQRILTSIALILLVLFAVLGLPQNLFVLFVGLVVCISVWEWSALAGLENTIARGIYLLCMIALMVTSLHFPAPVSSIFLVGLIFWLVALLFISIYPGGQKYWNSKFCLLFAGLPLFIPGWIAFAWLREQMHYEFHIFLLLGLVASADIGAFFSGKAFGKHKLAIHVSPNKTWEGFCGGLLACGLLITIIVLAIIANMNLITIQSWLLLVCCAMIIAAFSVIGDLLESMIKRNRGVKDSGSILPGHGGILDRIDGFTAAAPVYALLLMILNPLFTS